MKIQIYGTGCAKCQKLAENAQAAIQQLGSDAEIEKITDINAITDAGIMMTPALGIDGTIASSGKVLSTEAIMDILNKKNTSSETPAEPACACTPSTTQGDAPCCCAAPAPETPATQEACCCPTSATCCSDNAASACCSGTPKSKGKKLLTFLLLGLVVFSIIAMVLREITATSETPENTTPALPISEQAVTVYYFHGKQRCFSCNKIESLTQQVINTKFADQVAQGNVVFRSVDVEAPEHAHFVTDFALSTRGVVMQKGETYEKFDHVWSLVRDDDKFIAYIQDGVDRMLAIVQE